MKAWTDWETISHHVSICGRVVDSSGKPLPGVQLQLVPHLDQHESQQTVPHSGRSRDRQTSAPQRLERSNAKGWKETESRQDGTFFFLDCPDGAYILDARDKRSGLQTEQAVQSNRKALGKRAKDRKPNEGYQVELVLK